MVSILLNRLGELKGSKVRKGSLYFLCFSMMAWSTITIAQPTITSFAPKIEPVGASVTILKGGLTAHLSESIMVALAGDGAVLFFDSDSPRTTLPDLPGSTKTS